MLGTKIKFDKSVIYTSAVSVPLTDPDSVSAADPDAPKVAKKHKIDIDVSQIGADFTERRCFSWWKDDERADNYSILDSGSGLQVADDQRSGLQVADDDYATRESPLSSYMLQSSFHDLVRLLKVVSGNTNEAIISDDVSGNTNEAIISDDVDEAEKYALNKKAESEPIYQLAKNEIQSKKSYFYNWKM